MPSKISKILGVFLFCLLTLGAALAQTPQFVPFASAQPVLSAMRDALPPELKTSGPVTADAWNKWVRDRDKEIRGRIEEARPRRSRICCAWASPTPRNRAFLLRTCRTTERTV